MGSGEMNYRLIAKSLGMLLLAFGASMLACIPWSVWAGEEAVAAEIFAAAAVTALSGFALSFLGWKAHAAFYQREALGVVAFSWLLCGFFGALPYVFTGSLPFIPAIFESVSGLTTCGATVMDNIEAQSRGILFWRSLTHWLGGIGIIVLFVTVLPALGVGGKMLMKYESSGANPTALRPRIQKNAFAILKAYIALTLAQTLAYLATGQMGIFDALCHTFGTLSTGGYSTRQASIAAYDSIAVELVTIVFMIAGATSFALHDAFLRGKRNAYWQNSEWRAFMFILGGWVLLTSLNISGWFSTAEIVPPGSTPVVYAPESTFHAFRSAAFDVTSMATNTGFATDDFDIWPSFGRMAIFLCMFVGGCAGSTTGGVKVFRVMIIFKALYFRMERTFRPKHVRALRISGHVIQEDDQLEAFTYVLAYLLFYGAASLVMTLFGLPFVSAATSVAAAMSCSGPGLELLGAAESYSVVPYGGMLFLVFCMLVGRLEIFTAMVIFLPGYWRVSRH